MLQGFQAPESILKKDLSELFLKSSSFQLEFLDFLLIISLASERKELILFFFAFFSHSIAKKSLDKFGLYLFFAQHRKEGVGVNQNTTFEEIPLF